MKPNKATKKRAKDKPAPKAKTIDQVVKETKTPATMDVAKKEARTVMFPAGFLGDLRIFAAVHYGKGYTPAAILERACVNELKALKAQADAGKLPDFKPAQ